MLFFNMAFNLSRVFKIKFIYGLNNKYTERMVYSLRFV